MEIEQGDGLSKPSDFDPVPMPRHDLREYSEYGGSDNDNGNGNALRPLPSYEEAAGLPAAELPAAEGAAGAVAVSRSSRPWTPPASHGAGNNVGSSYDAQGADWAAEQDGGDSKEVEGSGGEMPAGSVGTVEAAQTAVGDHWYADWPRNEHETTREFAIVTRYRLIFTPLMLAIYVFVLALEFQMNNWVEESAAKNPSYGPSEEVLIDAGAKRTYEIVDDGEWWRLILPMFLHTGVVHFWVNVLGIMLTMTVERAFGWWRVGCIYLVSGFFGTIVSAVFVPTQVMAGASVALFGVFGAMWAEMWQNWRVNRDRCRVLVVALLAVVNIVLGLMPFLDNFAHIGGMLMGFFGGLGLLAQKTEDDFGNRLHEKRFQRLRLVAAITVPTLLILGLSVLYGRSDPTEWCGWCEDISCVEFPPGDSPWWECDAVSDECTTLGFEAEFFSNGTITITCPDNTVESSDECSLRTTALLLECCVILCLVD